MNAIKENLSTPAVLLYCSTLPEADCGKFLAEFGRANYESIVNASDGFIENSVSHNSIAQEPSLAVAFLSARKFAGLTQEQLAARAGLAVKSVRLLEKEGVNHRADTISQACQALDIPEILLRYAASPPEDRESVRTYFKQREK